MIGQVTHYFTVTARDRRWGFHVSSAGHAIIKPHQSYPPAGHPRGYDFRWEGEDGLRSSLYFISSAARESMNPSINRCVRSNQAKR